jgi:hypothetical protein
MVGKDLRTRSELPNSQADVEGTRESYEKGLAVK